MIDLSISSGLPIKYDETKGAICCGEEVEYKAERDIKLSELIPVLLNKYLKYPEKVYKHHHNIHFKSSPIPENAIYDLVYLPFGLLGIEFIKTHVFHSKLNEGKSASIVEVLHGALTVIIQKNKPKDDPYEFETYVEEISIITLRVGDRLAIPTGVYYTFVNTGVTPVVFSKISARTDELVDYSQFRREKGLAYFLISKNAKIEVVANPKYKIGCKLKFLNMKRILSERHAQFHDNEIASAKTPLFNLMGESFLMDKVCV